MCIFQTGRTVMACIRGISGCIHSRYLNVTKARLMPAEQQQNKQTNVNLSNKSNKTKLFEFTDDL